MKKHIKLFEDFNTAGHVACVDPVRLFAACQRMSTDDLRLAAYVINDIGFDQAEATAEDPETVAAVRALRSMTKTTDGVNAVKMLDIIDGMSREMLEDAEQLMFIYDQEGEQGLASVPGGREFLRKLWDAMC